MKFYFFFDKFEISIPIQVINNNQYKNELETLIDNNTLYTQYKPQQSSTSSTLNELSNGISSSSSTSSASSTSATSTPFNQHRNTTNNTNFNVNNRRDCLFYHSSDNYRNTNLPYARHHMFNNNNNNNFNKNNQQQQYQLESIPQEEKQQQTNEINVVIKHAAPFNGSKKIHTVSDLFEEDKKILLNANHFVRNDLNQLSTKSQPPTMMSFNEKRNFFQQQQQQQKMINNYVNHHTNNNNNNTNKRNGFSTNPQPAEV